MVATSKLNVLVYQRALARKTTAQQIIEMVAAYYLLDPADLIGRSREMWVAQPRQVCMYQLRRFTRYTLEEIGRFLGDRHHSTVINGVNEMERRLAFDRELAGHVAELDAKLMGAVPYRPGQSARVPA